MRPRSFSPSQRLFHRSGKCARTVVPAPGVDSKQIQDQGVRLGMQTMRMHGARMVLEGQTSMAEIVRQTEEEAVAALDPQAA